MAEREFVNTSDPIKPERRDAKRKHRAAEMDINMTSLIDVLFMLMLFFLLGTRFAAREGSLPSKMPEVAPGDPRPVPPPISIIVTEPIIDQPVVLVNSTRDAAPLKTLYAMLREKQHEPGMNDPTTTVYIKPERNVAWNYVMQAYNAVVRAGYQDIRWSSN